MGTSPADAVRIPTAVPPTSARMGPASDTSDTSKRQLPSTATDITARLESAGLESTRADGGHADELCAMAANTAAATAAATATATARLRAGKWWRRIRTTFPVSGRRQWELWGV